MGKLRLTGDEIVEWSFITPCVIEASRGPLFSTNATYKLYIVPEDDLPTTGATPDPVTPTPKGQGDFIGRSKITGGLIETATFPVRACTSYLLGYYEDAVWHFLRARTPLEVIPVLLTDKSVTVHFDLNQDEDVVSAIKTSIVPIRGANYAMDRVYPIEELEISSETNFCAVRFRNLLPNTGYMVTAWPIGLDGTVGAQSLPTKVATLSGVTMSVEDTGDTFLRICFRRPPAIPAQDRGLTQQDVRIGEYSLCLWEDPTVSLLRNAGRLSRGSMPQRYPLRRSEFLGKDVPVGDVVSVLVERLRPDTAYFVTLRTRTDTRLWEAPQRFRVRTTPTIGIARNPFATASTLGMAWTEPVAEELPNCLLDVDFPVNANYFTDRDVTKPYIGDKRRTLPDGVTWGRPAKVLSGVLQIPSFCELHVTNTTTGSVSVTTSVTPELVVGKLDPAELYLVRFRRVPTVGAPLPFSAGFLMFTPSRLMCRDVCRSRTSLTLAWGQLEVKHIAQLDPPPGHFKYLPDQHPPAPTQGEFYYYLEPIPFLCGPDVDSAVISDSEDEQEVYADGCITGSGVGYLGKRSRILNREPRPGPLTHIAVSIDEDEHAGVQLVCVEGAVEDCLVVQRLFEHNFYKFGSLVEIVEARWGDRVRGHVVADEGRFGKHCFTGLEAGKMYTFLMATWTKVPADASKKTKKAPAEVEAEEEEVEYLLKLVCVHRSATLPPQAVEHQVPAFDRIDAACQNGWARFAATKDLPSQRGACLQLTEVSEVFVALDVGLNPSDAINSSLKRLWLDNTEAPVLTEYLVEVLQVDMKDGVRIVVGEPRLIYYCCAEPNIQVVNLIAAARYELRISSYEPASQQWSSFSAPQECTTVQKVLMELKEMSTEYVTFMWGRPSMDNIASYTFKVTDLGLESPPGTLVAATTPPATPSLGELAISGSLAATATSLVIPPSSFDIEKPSTKLYKTARTHQRVNLLDELRHNALFDCSVVPHYDNGEQGLASNLLRFAHCVVGGRVVEAGVSHLTVTWDALEFDALLPPCVRAAQLVEAAAAAAAGTSAPPAPSSAGTCLLRLRTLDGAWEKTFELPSTRNSFIFENLPPNTQFCCHVAFVSMVPRCNCCPVVNPATVLPVAGRFAITGDTLPIPTASVTKIGECFFELVSEFRAEPQHHGEVLLQLELRDPRRAEAIPVELVISQDHVRRGKTVAIAQGLRAGRAYDIYLRQQYSLGTWGQWTNVCSGVPTLPKVQIAVVSLGETFVGLAASRQVPSLEAYAYTLRTDSVTNEPTAPPAFVQPSKYRFTVTAIGTATMAETHMASTTTILSATAALDAMAASTTSGTSADATGGGKLELTADCDGPSVVIAGLLPNTPYAAGVEQWALVDYGEASSPANCYTLQQILPFVVRRADNYLDIGCARDKRLPAVVTTLCSPPDDASAHRLSPLTSIAFHMVPLSEPEKPPRAFTVPCTEATLAEAIAHIAQLTPTHAYAVTITPMFGNAQVSSAPTALATLTLPQAAFRVSTAAEDAVTLNFCPPEGTLSHSGCFTALPPSVRLAPTEGAVATIVTWEFHVMPLESAAAAARRKLQVAQGPTAATASATSASLTPSTSSLVDPMVIAGTGMQLPTSPPDECVTGPLTPVDSAAVVPVASRVSSAGTGSTTSGLPFASSRRAFQQAELQQQGFVVVCQAADRSSCTIAGLMPDVAYKISARSTDELGAVDDTFHAVGTVTTKQFQTIVVNKLSENFAEITWAETAPMSEILARRAMLHQELQLATIAAVDGSNVAAERADDSVEVLLVNRAKMDLQSAERRCLPVSAGSVLFEQLSPETTYIVYIRLKRKVDDERGATRSVDGSWLPETQFDTLALLVLRVVHIGLDFVNLTWQAADAPIGGGQPSQSHPSSPSESRVTSPASGTRKDLPSTLFGTTTYFCRKVDDGEGSFVSGSSALAVRFQLRCMLMDENGGPGELLDDLFVTSTKDGIQSINSLQPGTAYAISMRVCYETLSGSWVSPALVTTEKISEPEIVEITQSAGEFHFTVLESDMAGGVPPPTRRHRLYEILTNDRLQYVPYTSGTVGAIRVGGLLRDFRYRIRIREIIQGRRFGEFVDFTVFWTQPYPPMITELVECRGHWCTIRWNVVATVHRPTTAIPASALRTKSFIYLLEKSTLGPTPVSRKSWQAPTSPSGVLAIAGGPQSPTLVPSGTWQQVCITDKPEHRFMWKDEGSTERFSKFAFRVRLTKLITHSPLAGSMPVWGKFSPVACWRDPATPQPVPHVELHTISPVQAIVKWRVPDGADAQPNLRYIVSLDASRASRDPTREQWVVVTTTSKRTCTIDKLQPASTYRVAVRAESAFGTSERATIIAFTTRAVAGDSASRSLVPVRRSAATTGGTRTNGGKPTDKKNMQLVVGNRPTQLLDDVPHTLFDKYDEPHQRRLRALAQRIGLNRPTARSLAVRRQFRTAARKTVAILHTLHDYAVAMLLHADFNPNGAAMTPMQLARVAFKMPAHGNDLRWSNELFRLSSPAKRSASRGSRERPPIAAPPAPLLLADHAAASSGKKHLAAKGDISTPTALDSSAFAACEVVPPSSDGDLASGFSPLHVECTQNIPPHEQCHPPHRSGGADSAASLTLLSAATGGGGGGKQRGGSSASTIGSARHGGGPLEDVTWTPHRDDLVAPPGTGPGSAASVALPSTGCISPPGGRRSLLGSLRSTPVVSNLPSRVASSQPPPPRRFDSIASSSVNGSADLDASSSSSRRRPVAAAAHPRRLEALPVAATSSSGQLERRNASDISQTLKQQKTKAAKAEEDSAKAPVVDSPPMLPPALLRRIQTPQ